MRNDPTKDNIFNEEKKSKISAKAVLIIAKQQEKEKLKSGNYFYEVSADRKTKTLKPIVK